MLHTPGGDALGLAEEQTGKSHWAGIAKEKEKLVNGGLGVWFHPFISAIVRSLTCQKQGRDIPFPDPSFFPSKGALSGGGRLYQPVGSEAWLSQKPPHHQAALAWVAGAPAVGVSTEDQAAWNFIFSAPTCFLKCSPPFSLSPFRDFSLTS